MQKKADTTSTLHERTKLSEHLCLRVEAHFLPTAIPFPLGFELPLPQSLPSLRNERGPYPTDQARGYSGQSIGKRACHHFSRPIGAGSFTRRRRHCAVTSQNVKDRPLAAKLWSPSSCSPSLVFHPYSAISSSSPSLFLSLSCSALCACDVSLRFFAPRNRLPVGRMYRYVLSNAAVYTYVSTNLNTRCVLTISILMRISYVWYATMIWYDLEILRICDTNRGKRIHGIFSISALKKL